ncbi:hypothetical protein OPQ81_010232 [Rhizoctonia solani]|nr:hypothetical protein OPQ81_010232 [Rhizoctonia solani]
MSTHSHHTCCSRRSHSSSRPVQYVTTAPASNYSSHLVQTLIITRPPTNRPSAPSSYSELEVRVIMLSPASLTLKFDAILDVPEGDEALSDTTLPLLFRPLSPRPAAESIGFPVSYSYNPAPVVEEIVVESPSSGASTLVVSPATTGHAEIAPTVSRATYVTSSGSTRSHHSGHSGHHHHHHRNGSTQYVYAQPARSVRSSGSVATARERPRYERAKSSGVTMTVIPATPRRVSRGSVISYRPEHDKHGRVKLSTKIRRLFGLGPKREEVAAERGRPQYVYPSSNSGRRSTSRVVYTS